MGVSGPENFDDDLAHTYPGELMMQLREDIEFCFAMYTDDQLDLDEANTSLLPPMDICITLFERYGKKMYLDKLRVRVWKRDYLALFDEMIEEYHPAPGHKEARRTVIEHTFDRFEAICLLDSSQKSG